MESTFTNYVVKRFTKLMTTRITGDMTQPYKSFSLAAPKNAAFTSFKPGASIL